MRSARSASPIQHERYAGLCTDVLYGHAISFRSQFPLGMISLRIDAYTETWQVDRIGLGGLSASICNCEYMLHCNERPYCNILYQVCLDLQRILELPSTE